MPYIGNTAADRFVASKAASVYSGDGSTTAFTLEHSVGSDEDILVSVDGVIQEPSVAYAVSSGTTLTFTAAPSSNAGNNIFVYYLFRTVGTVDHPATSALSATSGTFSTTLNVTGDATFDTSTLKVDSSNNRVGVGTATPLKPLHIQGSSEADVFLRRTDLTNKAWLLNVQSSTGDLNIKSRNDDGSASTTSMIIAHDGYVTMPLQPAFHIIPDQMNNIANNGTITFGTEIFDIGSNFASNTFTAPVTGKYQICAQIGLTTIDSAASFIGLDVHTSNRHYYVLYDPDFGQDNIYWELAFSGLVDMDADDTIVLKFLQSGGTTQTEIEDAHSNFSGYLVA
jgi:hypothetical protein